MTNAAILIDSTAQLYQRGPDILTADFWAGHPRAHLLPEEVRAVTGKLPLHMTQIISKTALLLGFTDAQFMRAVTDAVAFQEQPAHRCGACFRWVDPPDGGVLNLTGEGRILFVKVCPQCEKLINRKRPTERMQQNLQSLVTEELGAAHP